MSFAHDKRMIVYPAYIDSKKTVAEGRRIPKSLGVEEPYVDQMMDSCKLLKIPADIEGKHYPREWLPLGRLRVQLKAEDGTLHNSEVPDRRTLMLKLAELVKKHPTHGKRPSPLTVAKDAASSAAGGSSGAKAAAPAAKGAGASGGKKKGKK